jgi:hypothetical protein
MHQHNLAVRRIFMGVMGIAEIMDRSIEILRKYIKTILVHSIGYGVLLIVCFIALIIGGGILGSIGVLMLGPFFGIPAILLLIIAVFSFLTASSIGIIRIAGQEFLDYRIQASQAIKSSFKSIPRIMGIFTLAIIIYIPVMGGFWAVGYFLVNAFESSMIIVNASSSMGILFIVLMAILALGFGLVTLGYYTILSLSFQTAAIENKGTIASMKRSYYLVKGSFWRILGCVVLFYLTVYAIRASLTSFLGLIMGILYIVMDFLSIKQNFIGLIGLVYANFKWPLDILFWAVISPVSTIMMSLLYFNQRFKKEGFDIYLRLGALKQNQERSS